MRWVYVIFILNLTSTIFIFVINGYKFFKKFIRILNRHRWISRIYYGAGENDVEGTRQNYSVTSGNGELRILNYD